MNEDKGMLWAARHHAANICKHLRLIKPDPPELYGLFHRQWQRSLFRQRMDASIRHVALQEISR